MGLFKKAVFIFISCFTILFSNAQGFAQGDIILNANYGGPQVTPAILRGALNLYYKINKQPTENFTFNISNSGVLNAKSEYGFTKDLGLGLAASYLTSSL